MTENEREPLLDALRAAPVAAAPDGFRDRVLSRLDATTRRRRVRRTRLAAAALAIALPALVFTWAPRSGRRTAALDSLRAEHLTLSAELAAIRRLAATERSALLLGGDEQVDVVLSLAALPYPTDKEKRP